MAEVIVVPSSSGEGSYEIEVKQNVNGIQFACSCPAGQFGKLCKHKNRVLHAAMGIETSAGLQGNVNNVAALVASSRFPALIKELFESERLLEDARKVVSRAKKNLERSMLVGA